MKKIILVVDDEIGVLNVINRILSKANYQVLTTLDEYSAIPLLKERSINKNGSGNFYKIISAF